VSAAEREINALMALHPKGFDLSLGRITRLLERLGNPHEKLPPVIHIAGTNGKGSTSAFCRAILEAQGLKVHVHTSPHLVNWHERFRIGAEGGGSWLATRCWQTLSAGLPRPTGAKRSPSSRS
jgi:dihydrofolate synthase/folylpolyglutamate synthase